MKKEKQIPNAEISEGAETTEVVEKKGSKGRRIANIAINVALVIAIVLAAICTYLTFVSTSTNGVPHIFGVEFFNVKTDSMYPTLKPGDLVVAYKVDDPTTLVKGDIITYRTVINGEAALNTHRIHEVCDLGEGRRAFKTMGDKSGTVDHLDVNQSEVVGKYMFHIGGVGQVFEYLQSPTGFLLVIVLPVFLFFVFHLIQFFRVLFEYQNVKNRIRYEEERGEKEEENARKKEEERAAMEAQLREQLRAELMADMAKEEKPAEETVEE